MSSSDAEVFHGWLSKRQKILLLTHARPDGDAIGSLLGAYYMLREFCDVTPFINDSVPARYMPYKPRELQMGGTLDPKGYDGILCLDCATAERLSLPNGMKLEDFSGEHCSLDHHIDNPDYAAISIVDAGAASTTELLQRLASECRLPLSADAATLLLLGLVTDTGGFRFANVSPNTFQAAAALMAAGGDHDRVMNSVFFEDPVNLMRLRAAVVDRMQVELGGKLAYFVVTPDLLAQFDVDSRDTEDLIEAVRVVADAVIVVRLSVVNDGVRFSIRSKDPETSIIGIAHALGGGGHRLSAGAHLKGATVEEAIEQLRSYAQKVLDGQETTDGKRRTTG